MELSSPLFSRVVINGPGGSGPLFTIDAADASSTNEYVASATLSRPRRSSATPFDQTWLTNDALRTGRTLTLTMSPTPTDWATTAAAAPPSLTH